MARLVFIVGKSGRGKSTSCRNLDPETTAIVNSDQKELPFPKFEQNYSAEKGNYLQSSKVDEIEAFLKQQHGNKEIKTVVIDTWSRIMTDAVMSTDFRKASNGMKAWSNMAYENYRLINIINTNMRDDIIVYVLCHPETVYDEAGFPKEQIAVQGQQLRKFVPESFSSIVLYTEALKSPGKPVEYGFRTITSGEDTCKTPMGMFSSNFIENDLTLVSDAINNYYS